MRPKYFFLAFISLTLCLYSCVESQKVVIAKSGIDYVKPPTSKDVMQGEKIKYELWYNKDEWEVIYDKEHPSYKAAYKRIAEGKEKAAIAAIKKANPDLSDLVAKQAYDVHVEAINNQAGAKVDNFRIIIHKSQRILCIVHEEGIHSSFQTVSTAAIHSENNVIYEKTRKVNGQDVLYIKSYPKDPETSNFIYCWYFLTNKSGMVAVAVATKKDLFSEYESHIFDLLNGLVDSSLEPQIQPIVEDIESKLIKLKNLRDKGLITQDDYEKSKEKLLLNNL